MSSYPTALQDARVLHPSESDAEGLRVRAERIDHTTRRVEFALLEVKPQAKAQRNVDRRK